MCSEVLVYSGEGAGARSVQSAVQTLQSTLRLGPALRVRCQSVVILPLPPRRAGYAQMKHQMAARQQYTSKQLIGRRRPASAVLNAQHCW